MSTRFGKALGLSLVAISLILVPVSFLIVYFLPNHFKNFAWLPGLIIAALLVLGLRTYERALDKEWREEIMREQAEKRRQFEERQEWQRSTFEGFYDFSFRRGYQKAQEENREKTYRSSSYKSSSVEKAYRFFGLSYGAKESDVQREFRRLAAIYHPDKPGGSEAKFKELVNNRDIIYKYLGKS